MKRLISPKSTTNEREISIEHQIDLFSILASFCKKREDHGSPKMEVFFFRN